jgi:hypothetical protein
MSKENLANQKMGELAASKARNVWPDGWFVSNGEKIEGPFSAEEVFEKEFGKNILDPKSSGSSEVLVSRKGFKKWYRKDDLGRLFHDGSTIDKEVEESLKGDLLSELSQMESILSSVSPGDIASDIDGLNDKKSDRKEKIVVKKTLGPEALSNAPKKPFSGSSNKSLKKIVGAESESKAISESLKKASKKAARSVATKSLSKSVSKKATKKVAKKIAKATEDLQDKKLIKDTLISDNSKANSSGYESTEIEPTGIEHRREVAKEAASKVKNFTPSSKNAFSYYHMILRGRLRLGNIYTPLAVAFTGLLTLGFSSASFITSSYRDVDWHIDPKSQKNFSFISKLLMCLPLINVIYFLKLAFKVEEMEMQNSYRSVNKFLTAVFSLVPGLAQFYLQKVINNHWRLHALSVMKKEGAYE